MGQALSVVRQVGAGLQALHRRGVLHRDLKPANVLFRTVGPEGEDAAHDPQDGPLVRAMVGDLGLGKALDMSSRLTMIGGTPSYVSPEQAQGESLDSRSDEYSLGVLAYQLLAGQAPYSHASLIAAAEPTSPPPMGDHVPPDVEEVVLRALARDREDRWPSVGAFVSALGAAAGAHPAAVDSVPEALDPHRPRPDPAGAAALAADRAPGGRRPAPARAPQARAAARRGRRAARAGGRGRRGLPAVPPDPAHRDGHRRDAHRGGAPGLVGARGHGDWTPPHADSDFLCDLGRWHRRVERRGLDLPRRVRRPDARPGDPRADAWAPRSAAHPPSSTRPSWTGTRP